MIALPEDTMNEDRQVSFFCVKAIIYATMMHKYWLERVEALQPINHQFKFLRR